MGQMKEVVGVRLTAKAKLNFGEDLLICGAAPQLGSWDATNAVTMEWAEGDHWSTEVSLPGGVLIEFKLIVRGQSGLRWLGRSKRNENVVLETSLCRKGGKASFLHNSSELPYCLQVADVEINTSPCEEKGTVPEEHAPHVSRDTDICIRPSNQAIQPCSSSGYPELGPEARSPQPQDTAALLAGCAASKLGRKVTYSTTTTTTTYVTIDGNEDSVEGYIDSGSTMSPANSLQNGSGTQPADSAATGGSRSAGPDMDEAKETIRAEQREWAREQNSGLPRMGCVPIAWRQSGAAKVEVSGSWDGWQRRLALEPLPNGSGFGLLIGLPPGEYECKFIVDDVWTSSDDMDKRGEHSNNVFQAGDSLVLPEVRRALSEAGDGDASSTLALQA